MATRWGEAKAIETRYAGHLFRSRLEARYAVFFDALGVTWEYEPEGFDLGDGVRYLPDFWLPREELWVEIKPEKPDKDEWAKATKLVQSTKKELAFFMGTPGTNTTRIHHVWTSLQMTPFAPLCQCLICHRLIFAKWPGGEWVGEGTLYYCEWCDVRDRCTCGPSFEQAGCQFSKGDICVPYGRSPTDAVTAAFVEARSARFERGA